MICYLIKNKINNKRYVGITEITLSKRLKEHYFKGVDGDKLILLRTVKLTEELGELCDEVLSHSSFQRKDKLDNHNKDNLPEEFADVLITTFLLAKSMNVDIEKALEKKIKKVNDRYK